MIPLLLGALAVVLLVVGLFLIVVWVTGDNPPRLPAIFASDTPVPTDTPTPLPPSATPTITLTPEPSLTPTPSGPLTYIVEEGDTLFSISQQFGVTMDVLITANNLANPDTPLPESVVPGSLIEYVVKTGDNLQSIAVKFNSTVDAIAKANDLDPKDVLFVGRRLLVPVNIVTPAPTSTTDPNPSTPTATPRP